MATSSPHVSIAQGIDPARFLRGKDGRMVTFGKVGKAWRYSPSDRRHAPKNCLSRTSSDWPDSIRPTRTP